jgi:leucyl/phenylalanyl-tRNA--protein transferase
MRLTPELLEHAYRHGFFPMPDEFGIIRWYQPDPRAVIPLDGFHVSRSLERKLKRTAPLEEKESGTAPPHPARPAAASALSPPGRGHTALFHVSYDRDFVGVMRGCANRESTWITPEFLKGYTALHTLGKAHSVEIWQNGALVGGTYGVHIGGAFFAESKFHTVTDASKIAVAKLVEHLNERGFALLEVQFVTPHLASLGAIEIPHDEYARRLGTALGLACKF